MTNLLRECERYLAETLNLSVRPILWDGVGKLPVYLHDRYDFYQVSLLGTPCLLMVDRGETDETPAAIRKHVAQVQERWDGEIVYLREALSAYNRKRLIEQHVPFLIPGNQMYLPPFGLDLREHFKKVRTAPLVFSPSTQVVLLYVLLYDREQVYTPTRLAKRLGYASMTMTRAVDEIEMAGLGEVGIGGRERMLRFPAPNKALWEKARGYMRSPVKKRLWIRPPLSNWSGLLAGQTALARDSALAAPVHEVYAMSTAEWQTLRQHGEAIELHGADQEPGACRLELWSYSPHLFAGDGVVDPFSLFLSLQGEEDERIELALEEMMEARAGW